MSPGLERGKKGHLRQAQETGTSAATVQAVSQHLATLARDLSREVGAFLDRIRTD